LPDFRKTVSPFPDAARLRDHLDPGIRGETAASDRRIVSWRSPERHRRIQWDDAARRIRSAMYEPGAGVSRFPSHSTVHPAPVGRLTRVDTGIARKGWACRQSFTNKGNKGARGNIHLNQ
jgi:hypothetical protein